MATLQQKFPNIPASQIRAVPVSAVFTGPLNAGIFEFDQLVEIYNADNNDLLVLDGLELAANIDQLEFSRALVDPFKISIYRGGNLSPVLQRPFVFASFNQGSNFAATWSPTGLDSNGNESVLLKIAGNLNQTAALVAYGEVKIFATAMIYIIKQGQ